METFNLLSIGQRGVGKTVFLAGSYVESQSKGQQVQSLWFEGQTRKDQENLESILSYVARMGQYPPPTMKITDFNLSLKRRSLGRTQTLCHFRWWDLPGESCHLQNPDFQKLVLGSHGCCVFINAEALVHEPAYLQGLEDSVQQMIAIASLAHQHNLVYAFALIFTKCDLLEPGPLGLLQIEKNLQPLMTRFDAVKANYQKFYSAIPIVSTESGATLSPTGAAAPLLWLTSELRHHPSQSQQDLAGGLARPPDKASAVSRGLGLRPITRRYGLILALVGIGLVGAVTSLVLSRSTLRPEQAQAHDQQAEYEQILQQQPDNFDALFKLANLHIQQGQLDQAIPLIEKLVQQDPNNFDLRLHLAQLYELTGQTREAETAYDQILTRQGNNVTALTGKAVLRSEQGDTTAARALFKQAEGAASSDMKDKVRALAQSTLPPTNSEQ